MTALSREIARKQPANLPVIPVRIEEAAAPQAVAVDARVARPLTPGELLFLRAGSILLLLFALVGMAIATARTV